MDNVTTEPVELRFVEKLQDRFFPEETFRRDPNFDAQVIDEVRSIAEKTGMLDPNNQAKVKAFHAFSTAGLYFYCCHDTDKMVTCLCFLNLLWFVDDLLDNDTSLNEQDAADLVQAILDVSEVNPSRQDEKPKLTAVKAYVRIVRQRLLKRTNQDWLDRFWGSYVAYIQASLEETNLSRQGLMLDVDRYVQLRLLTSAVYPCVMLLSIVNDVSIPWGDNRYQEATTLTNRIISFSNDLFSYEKEAQSNSLNLLKVYMATHDRSLEQAVDYCVDLVNRDLDRLRQIQGEDWLGVHLDGMKTMIQGNAIWSINTKRYCTATSPFVDLRQRYHILSGGTSK